MQDLEEDLGEARVEAHGEDQEAAQEEDLHPEEEVEREVEGEEEHAHRQNHAAPSSTAHDLRMMSRSFNSLKQKGPD